MKHWTPFAKLLGSFKHPFNWAMTGKDRIANDILCALFSYRDIVKPEDGVPSLYLRRFYVYRGKDTHYFIHYIRRSDNDRDPHDHPWDFSSYMIAGGYTEQIAFRSGGSPTKSYTRALKPGQKIFNQAEHTHKVSLPLGQTAWTFVAAGNARRVWGFLTENGWVDWRTYLNIPDETEESWDEDIIRPRATKIGT